jgi:hypothetical protein
MDWSNTNHLLQALLVAALVFAFMRGYDSGNRL